MRMGKRRSDVRVADNLEEMPSHCWNETCQCECGAIWKFVPSMACPDCGGTHTFKILDPIEGYAPEG